MGAEISADVTVGSISQIESGDISGIDVLDRGPVLIGCACTVRERMQAPRSGGTPGR